jgi:DNA-binding transcriptional ArsR family regulator
MKRNNFLNHTNRKKIYECIEKNPGIHSRELSRQLKLPYSTLQYHIKHLEKYGVITSEHNSNSIHYYTSTTMGLKEKKVLSILRKETTRLIILDLLILIRESQDDISKNLEKHPATIDFHLKKLLDVGMIIPVRVTDGKILDKVKKKVIECTPYKNEIIYMLNDPEEIYFILKKYQMTLFNDEISNLIFYLIDYFILTGVPQRVPTPNQIFDKSLKSLFELIPMPYEV